MIKLHAIVLDKYCSIYVQHELKYTGEVYLKAAFYVIAGERWSYVTDGTS